MYVRYINFSNCSEPFQYLCLALVCVLWTNTLFLRFMISLSLHFFLPILSLLVNICVFDQQWWYGFHRWLLNAAYHSQINHIYAFAIAITVAVATAIVPSFATPSSSSSTSSCSFSFHAICYCWNKPYQTKSKFMRVCHNCTLHNEKITTTTTTLKIQLIFHSLSER